MKIGAFAKKYNVSIDAVRYYMELGLLYPEKNNRQYEFDDLMCSEMEKIIMLKDLGLTLAEISHYMYYTRLSSLDSRDFSIDIGFFEAKQRKIREEIKKLETFDKRISNHIVRFEDKLRKDRTAIGVSVFDLTILACPVCGNDVKLKGTHIDNNQVFEGELECKCGYRMSIYEGIMINGDYSRDSLKADTFDIVEYISETPMNYYNKLTIGLEWIRSRFIKASNKSSVILELGIGYGIFMRSVYDQLSTECTYICTDNDPKKLMYIKEIMEYYYPRARLLFILGDFNKMPLKEKSVDIIIDIAGTTSDNHPNNSHAYSNLLPIWKSSGLIFSIIYIIDKIGKNSMLLEADYHRYKKSFIQNILEKAGIQTFEDNQSDYLEPGGKYEQIASHGDKVYAYLFYGKRNI